MKFHICANCGNADASTCKEQERKASKVKKAEDIRLIFLSFLSQTIFINMIYFSSFCIVAQETLFSSSSFLFHLVFFSLIMEIAVLMMSAIFVTCVDFCFDFSMFVGKTFRGIYLLIKIEKRDKTFEALMYVKHRLCA